MKLVSVVIVSDHHAVYLRVLCFLHPPCCTVDGHATFYYLFIYLFILLWFVSCFWQGTVVRGVSAVGCVLQSHLSLGTNCCLFYVLPFAFFVVVVVVTDEELKLLLDSSVDDFDFLVPTILDGSSTGLEGAAGAGWRGATSVRGEDWRARSGGCTLEVRCATHDESTPPPPRLVTTYR